MGGKWRKKATLFLTSTEFSAFYSGGEKLKELHLSPDQAVPSRVIISRKNIASVAFISRAPF
jgi:hypothetical protein